MAQLSQLPLRSSTVPARKKLSRHASFGKNCVPISFS